MSRLRLKYVQAFVIDGRSFHYFRRRGAPRVRLPGLPGSAEFMEAYEAALAAAPSPIGASKRSLPGSISAALAQYFSSPSFRALAPKTQSKRRPLLERIREPYGHMQLASMPKEFVVRFLDTMTPHVAQSTLIALRHFAEWCVDRKLMRNDPTSSIKLKMPKSDGHHTWTDAEIARFEAHHPIGSKPRLAMALALYTAQRREDLVLFGRQHFRDGVLTVRQQKTGTPLTIPVHPDLAKIIAASAIGHLTLLTTKTGKSYGPDDFTEQFRVWCDAAGLPKRCVPHGLRKAACRRLAELGCTAHEIMAISGHKTLKEVERYTKAVDQAKLARAAMARTVSMPSQDLAKAGSDR